MDQRPASNGDHAEKRQAHDSDREMPLEPWSVFDAGSAKMLVKLQRLFTPMDKAHLLLDVQSSIEWHP